MINAVIIVGSGATDLRVASPSSWDGIGPPTYAGLVELPDAVRRPGVLARAGQQPEMDVLFLTVPMIIACCWPRN